METKKAQGRRDDRGLKRAVLTAPLWMPSTKGSSRLVADAVGVSQSFVSRTWREFQEPDEAADRVRALLAERQMVLVGFAVGQTGSCLVLAPSRAARAQPGASLSGSSKRRLRTLLATDLVHSSRQDGEDATESLDLWTSLEAGGHSLAGALVLVSGRFTVPEGVRPAVRCADAWHWQRLFTGLDQLAEAAAGPLLLELEGRIRRWYQAGQPLFSWTADRHLSAMPPASGAGAGRVMRLEPGGGLDEDILGVLRQGLADGTFSGESEISVGKLSRALGAPVRDVRSALRSLTEHGLVTAARSDSVVVRIPSLEDVSETYMARRALGAIVVRAASRWSPDDRALVKKRLEDLRKCVERKDVTRTHYADMEFQIALFQASGLSRIPAMLEMLTKQAFMHFAVIGARYAFSPKKILEDNTQIFESIGAGDLRAATVAWQSKMDEGLAYIAHQISLINQRKGQAPRP